MPPGRSQHPDVCACLEKPTFASLDLEEPDGCINSDAQRAASLFEFFDGELGQGYALAGTDLLVDSACVSAGLRDAARSTHP